VYWLIFQVVVVLLLHNALEENVVALLENVVVHDVKLLYGFGMSSQVGP
jgi:hypothetical protein